MRFVVFGAGAIGGVVGARLHQGGHRVTLIARGAHYRAIRDHGLTLEEPDERDVLRIDVAESPATVDWSGDEIVLLTTKSQDTGAALHALRASAPPPTPVVCMQNGVDNERQALRVFENVYGAVVMVPAAHTEPGVVQTHATRLTGIIDIGRYPDGADERCAAIVAALESSRFSSCAHRDVMRRKHAKLLLNLANAIGAIAKPGPEASRLFALAQEEGRAALTAAGIEFEADDVSDVGGRWERLGVRRSKRAGSSSWQSLHRRTGEIESDYLNGEIALLGRLHGVPTPVNAALARLADRAARDRRGPQTLDARDILSEAGERGGGMDALIESAAAEIAARAPRELDALVAISSPSGDVGGAEEAIAVCTALLPAEADAQRIPCSTSGSAHDLVGTIAGTGSRRALLLGHVDTVIAHESHASLRPEGDRLYGPGAADMKGGVVLALGVARALAAHPETFAELAVLIVTDEEWRTQEFAHAQRFAGYDACLCFEAGQLTAGRRRGGDRAAQGGRHAAGRRGGPRVAFGKRPRSGPQRAAGAGQRRNVARAPPRPVGTAASERRADGDARRRGVQRRACRRRVVVRHARRRSRGVR